MLVNILVGMSNLYAYSVIRHLYYTECYLGASIFVCSMSFSLLFHLIETKEVSHSIPQLFESQTARITLSGMFGEQPIYGKQLLLADRVFAAASILYSCYVLFRRKDMKKTTQVRWKLLLLQFFGGLMCLLYSDVFAQDPILFTIAHSLWHVCAYDTAYKICCPHSAFWRSVCSKENNTHVPDKDNMPRPLQANLCLKLE